MNRRDIVLALMAILGAPLAADAQQGDKVWRIGHLSLQSGPDRAVEAFHEQLRSLGYVEGRHLLKVRISARIARLAHFEAPAGRFPLRWCA